MGDEREAVRRVVTIVYIAMIAAVGAFGAILGFLPISTVAAAPRPSVEWGLLATGAGEYLVATFLGRRMLSARAGAALARARSYFLIRFAAAEAIAVFGLAVFWLGAPAAHAIAFFLASAAAFLFSYPSRDAFAEAIAIAERSRP